VGGAVAVTVDLVVLSVVKESLAVLVVRRGEPPYLGSWALPGGFVRPGEDLPEAAARELTEETGLSDPIAHLEQLASYGAPGRDPRGRVVTVAYLALVPESDMGAPTAGGDAADAGWQPVSRLLVEPASPAGSTAPDGSTGDDGALAFDHARILADGVERARAKLEYTALAAAFCPAEFTVAELRRVYEIVWGVPLDPRNFHRKVTNATDFLVPTGRTTEGERGRPAQLFRAGSAKLLHPPMLRPE
jgi:8-oxo-dGTP diphosphatase